MSENPLIIPSSVPDLTQGHHNRLPTFLLSLFVCALLIGGTFLATNFFRLRESLTLNSLVSGDAFQIAQFVQRNLQAKHGLLQRIRFLDADYWGRGQSGRNFAEGLVQQRNFFEMIAELDLNGQFRWIVPAGERETFRTKEIKSDKQWWSSVLEAARNDQEKSAGWFIDAKGHETMGVVLPLWKGRSQTPTRFVIARINPSTIFPEAVPAYYWPEFNVELWDETRRLGNLGTTPPKNQPFAQKRIVFWGNRIWPLWVAPTKIYASSRMTQTSRWILLGGIPGSILVSFGFYHTLGYRARHRRQTRQYLNSLESLNEISTAISAQLGTGREIMDRLAESCRQLLRMSRAGIASFDSASQTFKVYAFAGDVPANSRTIFPLSEMPTAGRCMESKDVLFVEDLFDDKDPRNQNVVEEFRMRSLILIPLQVQGKCIGMMGLSDSNPRQFTDAERRLARLLGSQASVILANSRLYRQIRRALELHQELLEQTRRDAATKTILLRELHHRVKNNLAGIVGLLSMDEPDLPADARQWLDRIVERIQTMARAHELFTHGVDKVGLPELVEQVLPSLSVLLSPGIEVRKDIDGTDLRLDTQQAVTLAMVLHELCSNAIVHGLVDGGQLTIKARRSDGKIIIDVIDQGRSDALPALADHLGETMHVDAAEMVTIRHGEVWREGKLVETIEVERGIGLKLVSELVRRELKGRFQLIERPGSGTIARVELPASVH